MDLTPDHTSVPIATALTPEAVHQLLEQMANEETEKDTSGLLNHPGGEDDRPDWDDEEDNEEDTYLNNSCTVAQDGPSEWTVWFMLEGEIEANMPRFSVQLQNGVAKFTDDTGEFEYLDGKSARTVEEFKQILDLN